MSISLHRVRTGFFLDSVALMRISRAVADSDGVEDAALMMGSPTNQRLMLDAGLLSGDGIDASGGDLVIAVRARSGAAAEQALKAAEYALDADRGSRGQQKTGGFRPRDLRGASQVLPVANLVLISVPGSYAAAEARKALASGRHVMIFSDNVALADEVALKRQARDLGLLVMGPDCGTAIIDGVPLAFANPVSRGEIGIVGASGTGMQEVSSLLSEAGGGVSHALGVGGRDLSEAVGGISTLMAMEVLEADPGTRHIVLISKPPADDVVARITAKIAASAKSYTVCFVGADSIPLPHNATMARTLKAAAEQALGGVSLAGPEAVRVETHRTIARSSRVRGLFAGGTLAAEAQVVFTEAGEAVASNAPVPGARELARADGAHVLLDLGDDEYTRGRPHPMIDPAVRDAPLAEAFADAGVGVILLDIVIGQGAAEDPAGHLANCLNGRGEQLPVIVCSVTGTRGDRQDRSQQIATLREAGVVVAPSNADAAALALECIGSRRGG